MFTRGSWRNLQILLGFFCTLAITEFVGANTSAYAADTVVLRFGVLEEYVPLSELQKAAETGEFPQSLQPYAKRLSAQQRQLFLGVLRMRLPVNVVTTSRLLNTQIGTIILSDFSKVVVRKDNAGVQALRAGLVLGSNAPQGLSLISFIAAYPSKNLKIDLPEALKFAGSLNTSFWRTQQFMLAIAPRLDSRPPQLSLPFDPSQAGSSQVQTLNLNLNDQKRNRDIPLDIYWSSAVNTDKPVIVFSHGLGSVRTELRYLAQHLASHGYLVAALEHPGSNETNTKFAVQGKTRLLKPQEFLDRPQDVSFVLDELEKLNQTANNPLQGKLATDKVMVVGYSLGGATALSLAGGELQLERLKQRCKNNLSTLSLGEGVQCLAQELPENNYQLRDPRVKQVISLNPATSLLFGETGLTKVQVPTLVLTSSADKTTPALGEQIVGFNKIPSSKWLVGVIGATHLSVKDPSTTLDEIGKPNTPFSGGEVFGDNAADVRKYLKVIALAMAAQLTPEANKYSIFLSSNYALFASTKTFPFRLVTEIPPSGMRIIREFEKQQHNRISK